MSIEEARKVFLIEEQGLAAVRGRIGEEFIDAVNLILSCPSRLVITGIGKSGIIGQKIAATLNSTGTPSFYLHSVEAMHGDLGMVMPTDVVIAISYSGETVEITSLVTSLKKKGISIIAMTGDLLSKLARSSDIVLDVSVPREACPLGLAPTASTTATLAMGDALSVVLQNRKKFQEADFRKNHPGGSLGDRLKVKVEEVMLTGEEIPVVGKDGPAPKAIQILNEKNLGAVIIVNGSQQITGIVTDGDIRRAIAGGCDFNGLKAKDIMTKDPITIDNEKRAADALSIMQHHEITVLPVVDREKRMVGILHLHDLLGKGEFRFLV